MNLLIDAYTQPREKKSGSKNLKMRVQKFLWDMRMHTRLPFIFARVRAGKVRLINGKRNNEFNASTRG